MTKLFEQGLGKNFRFWRAHLQSEVRLPPRTCIYLRDWRSSAKLPPSWSPGKQTPKLCWLAPAAISNCHVPTHSRTHCISQKLALLWTKFRNAANHMSLHCVGHLLYTQHKNTTQHCKNFGRQGAVGAVMHLTLPLLRICAWDPAEEAFFTSLSNDHGPPGSNELQKCLLSVWFQICNRNLSVWCHGSTASLLQYQSCTSWIWTAERDQEAQKWSQSTNYQHLLKHCAMFGAKAHHGGIFVGSKIVPGI